MTLTDCHSFHDCPLRSSSLLIVSKEKQTIITATDEVFDMLGYEPTELIGKSIRILDPRIKYYYAKEGGEKKERFTLCHETHGQIPFEICIHHDPLTNATDLDYWLIRPVNAVSNAFPNYNNQLSEIGPVTILRLSPFGTIEHAYPSSQFPQQSHELKGRPIMLFVHESDVRSLCEKLCNVRRRTYHTFRVRWLNLFQPEEDHDENNFEWVSFTIMNSPRRLSCDSTNDPQSRPVCIIRPAYDPKLHQPNNTREYESSYLTPYLLSGLVSGTIKLLCKGTSFGINHFFKLLEALHIALNQGKMYMIEFCVHLLSQSLKMVNEAVYFSSSAEFKHAYEYEEVLESHMVTTKYDDSTNKDNHKEYLDELSQMQQDSEKRKRKKYHLYGLSSVKVSMDNGIWSVPLYFKKTFRPAKYLTATQQQQDTKSVSNKLIRKRKYEKQTKTL